MGTKVPIARANLAA